MLHIFYITIYIFYTKGIVFIHPVVRIFLTKSTMVKFFHKAYSFFETFPAILSKQPCITLRECSATSL